MRNHSTSKRNIKERYVHIGDVELDNKTYPAYFIDPDKHEFEEWYAFVVTKIVRWPEDGSPNSGRERLLTPIKMSFNHKLPAATSSKFSKWAKEIVDANPDQNFIELVQVYPGDDGIHTEKQIDQGYAQLADLLYDFGYAVITEPNWDDLIPPLREKIDQLQKKFIDNTDDEQDIQDNETDEIAAKDQAELDDIKRLAGVGSADK